MSQQARTQEPGRNLAAILVSRVDGRQITVRATTEHPCSSYGIPVWVDRDNISYGQVGLPIPSWRIAWQGRA